MMKRTLTIEFRTDAAEQLKDLASQWSTTPSGIVRNALSLYAYLAANEELRKNVEEHVKIPGLTGVTRQEVGGEQSPILDVISYLDPENPEDKGRAR